jgi:hypothetical protein
MADWNFYLAYNLFRLASITQGIAKRVVDGIASSAEARATGEATPAGTHGLEFAQRRRALSPETARHTHADRTPTEEGETRWTSTTRPAPRPCRQRLNAFMAEHVFPAEAAYFAEIEANTRAGRRWTPLETIERLKPKAREAGLWNLFLPPRPTARPARRQRVRLWPEQPGLRAAGRDHGRRALEQRGLQLQRARHRQHGGVRALRHARAQASAGSSRCWPARSAAPSR